MVKSEEKIINYLKEKKQATPADLSKYLGINRSATHRQIKKLVERGDIYKAGKAPKVFYLLREKTNDSEEFVFDNETENLIEQNFMIITPDGTRKEGVKAFIDWCSNHNEDVQKTAAEYVKTLKKNFKYKKGDFINGNYKIKKAFDKVYLDNIFYLDFYAIERFGKTKLGQLLLYAKQSQNQKMIDELINKIKPKIISLIKKEKVDAVGFIPPTVKREIQLMREVEKGLELSLSAINLIKIKTEVSVPQKTLNKLKDRIKNAEKTIFVSEKSKFNKILLIDDAVGSGSTLNETAKKIKEQNIAKKVIGLAITGSFSGFEIISEV